MHRIFRVKAYEKEHGPHFNEEYARKAVMKMENEGGNGGWWWIWIILIWFCWGGNGFGGRNAGALASELNTDANTNLLMQAINGNKDAISNLSTTL